MTSALLSVFPPISLKIVLTCLLWYLVSSITSHLTRVILVQFPYPLFLGQFQYLIGGLLALSFISVVRSFPNIADQFSSGTVPNDNSISIFNRVILIKVLPLAMFQFVGKVFSLHATSLIPLATISSIKALSPLLIVIGYRVIYKVKFPLITYLSLTPLLAGVIVIITIDSGKGMTSGSLINMSDEFDWKHIKGLSFCLASAIIFAGQNIYGKQLITWNNGSGSTSPISLALSTESTKSLSVQHNATTDQYGFYGKHVRQRTNSTKLPYSTSDLKLDEKFEVNNSHSPYERTIEQNQTILNNPLGWVLNNIKSEDVHKPDKMTLILYCSSIGFLFAFGGFLMNELPYIIRDFQDAEELATVHNTSQFLTVFSLILINSLSHFLQSLLAFYLLGSIPAVSYSIASMMKRIILIVVGLLITVGVSKDAENDSESAISSYHIYGLVLISIGLYCYDKWGSRVLKN